MNVVHRIRTRMVASAKALDVGGCLAVAVLFMFVLFAAVPGWFTSVDPTAQDVINRLQGPSSEHWFGTDELGRDAFSRVIHGARTSLITAVIALLVSLPVGTAVGVFSGYLGGRVDEVVSRGTDILLAFPGVLVAMIFIAVAGRSIIIVPIVIGIVNIPAFVRVTRAVSLQVRGLPYVDAARSAGAGTGWLVGRSILPNTTNEISTQALLVASRAIIVAAGLSFLGLGVPPPAPSWGAMLSSSRAYLNEQPWYGVFPGVFIALLVLSLQVLSRSARSQLQGAS